jgi:hypothetical protein
MLAKQAQTQNPQAKFVKKLYYGLPSGKWTEEGLSKEVLRILDRDKGDYALASALIRTLLNAGAITLRDGKYQKADRLPDWPRIDYGTEAFNEELRKLSEAEQKRFAEVDEQRKQEYENSPAATERRLMERFIDQRVIAYVDKRLAPLEAELKALRELIAEREAQAA